MTGPLEAGPLIPVPQAPEPGRLSPESPAEYTVEPRKPNLQSSVEAPALEQVFRPKNMPFGTAKMLSTERPAPSDYHHSPPPTPAPLPPLLVPAARTKVLLVEDNIVNLRVNAFSPTTLQHLLILCAGPNSIHESGQARLCNRKQWPRSPREVPD